ncbi:hypothetical protein KQX54_017308 [Cotesia glomerata]|uniref:Uncharacterized protein n=1 Tax=Cotesia glomerata TaxID=32391 RepID=A0AAV7I7E8_COTGL|nr:hypothetical protein KQX54_017308 [Cotesia glomerata]
MTRPFQISSDAMNALESSFDVTPQAQNPLPPSGKLKTLKPVIVKTQSNANHNPLLIKCNKILEEVLAKINSMDQGMQRIEAKLESYDTFLKELNTTVDALKGNVGGMKSFIKPAFVPFRTQEDIDLYEDTPKEHSLILENYILNFRGSATYRENVRYVLKYNFLFTEELLTKINYSFESETKKITLLGKRLDHELCHIFKLMFPEATIKDYANAMSAALKAAANRVNARKKSLEDGSKETPRQIKRKKKNFS